MARFNRRNFLKASGLTVLPALVPFSNAFTGQEKKPQTGADTPLTNFFSDGETWNTTTYIGKLQQINSISPIKPDRYGAGGAVEELEKKFAAITGKEKVVFMPSGTMANQLAIKVLSGENTKVFVQETSHVFRDEADAAQSVHNKRLIALAKGEAYFTSEELQQSVDYHKTGEVFKTGIGAVTIEIPVRRNNGRMMPIEELKKISAYCRKNDIKMHLDGARLFLASAWSGVSIKEYSDYFDTVYISLYKYLGASAGAVLCGPKAVMDKMDHLMKIYGGSMYGNWTNAAIASNQLEDYESRLKNARKRAEELFALLNGLPEIKVVPINDGTNIYEMQIKGVKPSQFQAAMANEGIRIFVPGMIYVNVSILYRDTNTLFNAFKNALKIARA